MLTQARLLEVLHYDLETGWFTRRFSRGGRKAGDRAGRIDAYGHRTIRVDNAEYRAGRLAWLYVFGEWPQKEIDHISRDRGDDRIANLREASRKENLANRGAQSNSRSGIRGVFWDKRDKKWVAKLFVDRRLAWSGYFDDPETAKIAYMKKSREIHGEFAVV